MAVYASNAHSRGPFANSAPAGLAHHGPPAGTFLPGTKVQVGTHRVVIDKYLSEGGFAHVYVVTLPRPVDGNDKAVLKRVAVPDKEHLANMRTEVETMKRLRGQKQIVKYIDSHASQLKGGGYEVFLLMEYCQGGGLIDFMNTRLQNRLTEPEIIKIFTDIAEGVANMHYLKPPLLHRDLKVENVLISTTGAKKIFKLCDFGSAAPPKPAATSAAEARIIEDDIQRHTTLQYRSPEMVDVYRKLPIDEKSDIWALGVFLYKLCYYTTPFEEVGQMAILNAKFKYPGYPRFSDQMKLLIASMLREKPSDRPNIYQVLQKACQLDKRELPVRDIYSHRSQSESRKDQVLPNAPGTSQTNVGATLTPHMPDSSSKTNVPDIAPMRRGRPTKPVSHHGSAKPSPSPLRMMDAADPFAALDGGKGPVDELSSKFPTLDEFSLMTDRGKKFQFEQPEKKETREDNLAERVTYALADQAFARAPSPAKPLVKAQTDKPQPAAKPQIVLERKKSMEKREESRPAVPAKSAVMSTGPSSTPPLKAPLVSERPIWKVPSHETVLRPSSRDRSSAPPSAPLPEPTEKKSRLARLLQHDNAHSQGHGILDLEPRSPTSSRPSLEGGRPSKQDIDLGLTRSRSLNIQQRPVSVNIGKGPTHIKDREIRRTDYSTFTSPEPADTSAVESDMNIHSDVDFLKAREEEERERKGHHKRLSSGSKHGKRSSLPHIALSGTKNILTGRFGDAFKMFEGSHDSGHQEQSRQSPRLLAHDRRDVLTPITGSEVTDLSDDRREPFDETEDLSPEMRRELEKRKLEAEERRVEQAAAEYRQRIQARAAGGGGVGVNRAATIQTKVHSLLNENSRPAAKTATGYGRFTNEVPQQSTPPLPRQPVSQQPMAPAQHVNRAATVATSAAPKPLSAPASAMNLPQTAQSQLPPATIAPRPSAPPKPQVLRTGQGNPVPVSSMQAAPAVHTASSAAALGDHAEREPISPDDWEAKFSKRFPSLSGAGVEMVETDVGSGGERKMPTARIREV
jgi:AP2-associated kinase